MGRVAMSVVIAGFETFLLFGYLLFLPLCSAWLGRAGAAVVSVLFLALAIYLPGVVLAASGRSSQRWTGAAATLGTALGAGVGIWLGFRVLEASQSELLGEASVVVITLLAAGLGSFVAALASIRGREAGQNT